MSVGLRDQRVRIYGYASTSDEGVPGAVYEYRETRWARLEAPTGREVTVGMQAAHRVDAVLALADEADVRANDLILLGADRYLVRAVLGRRHLRETQCLVQLTDDEGALLDLDVS